METTSVFVSFFIVVFVDDDVAANAYQLYAYLHYSYQLIKFLGNCVFKSSHCFVTRSACASNPRQRAAPKWIAPTPVRWDFDLCKLSLIKDATYT